MDDYREKTVLVTGGHGFLGKHVMGELQRGYKKIITFSHQECNLTEQVMARDLLARVRPEVIIHLAASVGGISRLKEYLELHLTPLEKGLVETIDWYVSSLKHPANQILIRNVA